MTTPEIQEAGRIIAERVLATVTSAADLALLSPARVAGMLDIPTTELNRHLEPVRLGHRTIRYRLSDVQDLISPSRHQGTPQ